MESYTIGRENFGMEKEFIIEVVQNCPNPACRYYKSQMELTQKTLQHLGNPNYLAEQAANNPDIRSSELIIAIYVGVILVFHTLAQFGRQNLFVSISLKFDLDRFKMIEFCFENSY